MCIRDSINTIVFQSLTEQPITFREVGRYKDKIHNNASNQEWFLLFHFTLFRGKSQNGHCPVSYTHLLSMIPAILIPIIAAPFVDTCERKKVIVRLDAFNGICYLLFAWYLSNYDFSYTIYLLYALLTTSTGSIYQLAYASLYPDLIPKGFMQKGYSCLLYTSRYASS